MIWSWDYLFVPQNQPVPSGVGFGSFSAIHLGVLGALAVAIVALVMIYRAADAARRRRIQLTVAWSTLMLEVVRQLTYLVMQTYSPEILPLHLCGIATFALFIDALRTNRWTSEYLYALGWWGALAADLFPDWATRPILNVFTWQSFTIHALIVGYVAMRIAGGDLVPQVRNLWRVVIMVAVFAGLAAVVNQTLGTNFWFLNAASPGSPLEPISALAGPFYIPVLAVLLLALWTLLYLPWVLRERRLRATTAAID
jgi:hypothetical integral membrane protein (TIGR02206 family)